jgi:hypothetical protein
VNIRATTVDAVSQLPALKNTHVSIRNAKTAAWCKSFGRRPQNRVSATVLLSDRPTPCRAPHMTHVQPAPCQSPETTIVRNRLSQTRKRPRRLPPSGMYTWSRNHVDRLMCHRRRNSVRLDARYGRLKFGIRS